MFSSWSTRCPRRAPTRSEAAEYVGHHGLATKVRDFADGWDIHREKYADALRHLVALLEAVDETFADLDRAAAAKVGLAGGDHT